MKKIKRWKDEKIKKLKDEKNKSCKMEKFTKWDHRELEESNLF